MKRPRRTPEEVEAVMVPQLVNAIYPVLIPVEQQDCAIQARNHARMTEIATKVWREFALAPEQDKDDGVDRSDWPKDGFINDYD